MFNDAIDVKLRGYVLARADLYKTNSQGKIVYHTNKIISCGVECPATKIPSFEHIEHYTIDESIIDYDLEEIEIIDDDNFVIVNEFEIENVENLQVTKNIDEYLKKKYLENLKIEKLTEILEFELMER